MVARTALSKFVVTTWRDGDILDAQIARDGDRATQIGVVMLMDMAPLQHGDRLDVSEAPDDPAELPEPSRASHLGG